MDTVDLPRIGPDQQTVVSLLRPRADQSRSRSDFLRNDSRIAVKSLLSPATKSRSVDRYRDTFKADVKRRAGKRAVTRNETICILLCARNTLTDLNRISLWSSSARARRKSILGELRGKTIFNRGRDSLRC